MKIYVITSERYFGTFPRPFYETECVFKNENKAREYCEKNSNSTKKYSYKEFELEERL